MTFQIKIRNAISLSDSPTACLCVNKLKELAQNRKLRRDRVVAMELDDKLELHKRKKLKGKQNL